MVKRHLWTNALPCHMSLFHSVVPQRHGITTNLYLPMVRPVNGLFEQLRAAKKTCAMYYGWMSPAYLARIHIAVENIRRVLEACGEGYTVVITADHGGHDRTHGTDLPEDMTIPMFCFGKAFPAGRQFRGSSILDVAPTIARLMGAEPAVEWEGTSLIPQ